MQNGFQNRNQRIFLRRTSCVKIDVQHFLKNLFVVIVNRVFECLICDLLPIWSIQKLVQMCTKFWIYQIGKRSSIKHSKTWFTKKWKNIKWKSVLYMYYICIIYVLYMYICILHVYYMYYVCIMFVLYMYYICIIYVLNICII